MGDDTVRFLEELREIERKKTRHEPQKGGRYHGREEGKIDKADQEANILFKRAETDPDYIKIHHYHVRDVAQILVNSGYTGLAMKGAQLYERIGLGQESIPGLLKSFEEDDSPTAKNLGYSIEKFIKRNAGKKQHPGGLEGRVGVFILVIIGGIALSAFSLTATGNAISNLTTTTPGLLGIIFFIVGLAGLAFNLKKK